MRSEALDGVLYTHDHADHTHGIDDLRMVAYAMKKRIDVCLDEPTRAEPRCERFAYCFETPAGSTYPPILTAHPIEPPAADPRRWAGRRRSRPCPSRRRTATSARSASASAALAYSPDISDIPDASLPLLQGLDVWIVDALRYTPHPSHFSVKQALDWIERLAPKRAILTHMTADLDYEALRRELPADVEPAYDGMVIEFD